MYTMKMSPSVRAATRPAGVRPGSTSMVVRCQPQQQDTSPVINTNPEPALAAPTGMKKDQPPFAILNRTTEAINGRAAMLGFVSAVAVEAATHHTVISQMAGRYDNQQLVERAIGTSDLTFGMIVALVTMGSLMPRLLANEQPESRSFGPFTPGLENTLGRAAMLGFAGVIIIEAIKGSSLI